VVADEPLQVEVVKVVEVAVVIWDQTPSFVLVRFLVVPVVVLKVAHPWDKFCQPHPCHKANWCYVLDVIAVRV
jgi:hypothetical protein